MSSEPSWYHNYTEAQLRGRLVRTRVELRNGQGTFAPGTLLRIDRKFAGLSLRPMQPCACCGFAPSISKVSPQHVDLVGLGPVIEEVTQ